MKYDGDQIRSGTGSWTLRERRSVEGAVYGNAHPRNRMRRSRLYARHRILDARSARAAPRQDGYVQDRIANGEDRPGTTP